MNKYKSLWASVLGRAIDDLNKKLTPRMSDSKKSETLKFKQSAKYWFSRKESNVGSFVWICDILEIDPEKTKSKIFYNKQMHRASR